MTKVSVSLPVYIFPSIDDLKRCISKIYREQFTVNSAQCNISPRFETEIPTSMFLSGKKYLLYVILYTQLNPHLIREKERKKDGRLIKRGRSRKCEDHGLSSGSCGGSMSLCCLPEPRLADERSRFFLQLDAHPGVIYSNYKSARLPRWDACNACLAVRGRSNASIIRDPRRPGSICTRESVRACHEPSCAYLSARVRAVWSLSGKSVLLIGLKGGFHCNNQFNIAEMATRKFIIAVRNALTSMLNRLNLSLPYATFSINMLKYLI